MSDTSQVTVWIEKSKALQQQVTTLREKVDNLEEAARVDLSPKLDRIETMTHALDRDVHELGKPSGADESKVAALYQEVDLEVRNFHHEVDAMSAGNPTTISAGLDAVDRLFQKSK